jgi:hypothetical protein
VSDDPLEPQWSSSIECGLWLCNHLAPFRESTVASFVPADYEAYARLLHPVCTPQRNGRLVRWTEVAEWSGLELTPTSQFESIAMGPGSPRSDLPWEGQGPCEGSLYAADAEVLAATLREFPSSPAQCWFGLWSGYGSHRGFYGPELELDSRAYYIFAGPVEHAFTTTLTTQEDRTPNLWWPENRSWFVATEIDLQSTYVGGPHSLIGQLVDNSRIEAPEVAVTDMIAVQPESWLQQLAERAAGELMEDGVCEFETTLGTVTAELQRSRRRSRWSFHYRCEMSSSGCGGGGPIVASDEADLHRQLEERLARSAFHLAH